MARRAHRTEGRGGVPVAKGGDRGQPGAGREPRRLGGVAAQAGVGVDPPTAGGGEPVESVQVPAGMNPFEIGPRRLLGHERHQRVGDLAGLGAGDHRLQPGRPLGMARPGHVLEVGLVGEEQHGHAVHPTWAGRCEADGDPGRPQWHGTVVGREGSRSADRGLSRRVRVRPSAFDRGVVHLALADQGIVPDPDELAGWVDTLAGRDGVHAIRTGALFAAAAERFSDAGFSVVDTLMLLRADLADPPWDRRGRPLTPRPPCGHATMARRRRSTVPRSEPSGGTGRPTSPRSAGPPPPIAPASAAPPRRRLHGGCSAGHQSPPSRSRARRSVRGTFSGSRCFRSTSVRGMAAPSPSTRWRGCDTGGSATRSSTPVSTTSRHARSTSPWDSVRSPTAWS